MAVDKLVDSAQLNADLTSVANAIRTKGGTSAQMAFPNGFVSAVNAIPTGGGENYRELDEGANFFDYNGDLICSWTPDEVASASALPNNPYHELLTAEGWNWTLQEIKDYFTTVPDGKLYIGQHYRTTDGTTKIVVDIPIDGFVYYINAAGNGLVFNYGDETEDTNSKYHTYARKGRYIISITGTVSSLTGVISCNEILLNNNSNCAITHSAGNISVPANMTLQQTQFNYSAFNVFVCPRVSKIPMNLFANTTDGPNRHIFCLPPTIKEIASNSIGHTSGSALTMPVNLNVLASGTKATQTVMVLNDLTSISSNINVSNGKSIRKIRIGKAVSLPTLFCQGQARLEEITLCEGFTIIPQTFVANSYLGYFVFPSTITQIASQAFYNCPYLRYIKFQSATPPTVENSNAFDRLPQDCKILVPSGSLSAYQTATNYPDPNTYNYEEY